MDVRPPKLRLALDGANLTLGIDAAWLKKQPLTAYSLQQEAQHWDALGDARPFGFQLTLMETLAA